MGEKRCTVMGRNSGNGSKKNRIRGAAMAFGLVFLTAATAPAALAKERPDGVDDAVWAALSDETIEFDELEALVRYYNPDYRQVLDQIMPSVEMTREAAARLEEASEDYKNQAEEYAGRTDMEGMVQYETLSAMSEAAETTSETFRDTAEDIGSQTETVRDQALLSLIKGCQQIYIGYNQAVASRELSEAAVQLADAAAQSARNRRDAGMAAENDVLAAQQTLLSAQNQLLSLDQTLTSLRHNLYVMTGWKLDDSARIGAVPAPDLTKIDSMDPSADITQAVDASYSLKNLDDSLSAGGISDETAGRMRKETEEGIRIQLEALYQTVLADRAAYEASNAALETARLAQETSERQYLLGMIGGLQYQQARIDYLQQKMAVENASMSLFQAILDYEWALQGIMETG